MSCPRVECANCKGFAVAGDVPYGIVEVCTLYLLALLGSLKKTKQ